MRAGFRAGLANAAGDYPSLGILARTLISMLETLHLVTVDLDTELKTKCQQNPMARRLKTVPGGGPVSNGKQAGRSRKKMTVAYAKTGP